MWQRLQFVFGAIAFIIHIADLSEPLQLYPLAGHHFVYGIKAVPGEE